MNYLTDEALNNQVANYVSERFNFLLECTQKPFSLSLENEVLAQGELLSTFMFNAFLEQEGINSQLLAALDFMRINEVKEPDFDSIRKST